MSGHRHAGSSAATAVLAALAMLLLTGCAGLSAPRPQSTVPAEARAGDWAARSATGAVPVRREAGPEAAWWEVFGDPELTRLIAAGLAANQELAVAEARIRQAGAGLREARAGRLPQLGASASASRAELSRAGAGAGSQLAGAGLIDTVNEFYTLGFELEWELDVFGRQGALIDAARGDLAATQVARQGVALSVASAIAAVYLDLRARQAELAVERDNVRIAREQLEIAEGRLAGGLAPELDVLRARGELDAAKARLPGLTARIDAAAYALGVLTGNGPQAEAPGLTRGAPLPAAPASLAVGVRSDLLQRRPDVVAASLQVEAAAARADAAVRTRFPSLILTGLGGTDSSTLDRLLDASAVTWLLGAAAALPVYQGGRIRAGIEQAEAALEIAALNYDRTALQALQEADTALTRFVQAGRERGDLRRAAEATAEAARVALRLYDTGLGDYLTVLDTQRRDREVTLALVGARDRVNQAAVDLYRAVGGGWSPAPALGSAR